MWELDNNKGWVPKNDAFGLWGWRRLLWVPWTTKRSNPSIPKEINPEYLLERLMLKLKLQHFGHLMQRANSLKRLECWEKLKAGEEGEDRGWGGSMASLTQWTCVWAVFRRWWKTGKPGVLQSVGSQSQTQLSNWTTTTVTFTEWMNEWMEEWMDEWLGNH